MASKYLKGRKIDPPPVRPGVTAADLMDQAFVAYNGARMRQAAQLITEKRLEKPVTVGVTLTGALTPAGLGISCVIPLIKAGFVDWIISTGANLYHDTHFGIGLDLREGNAQTNDVALCMRLIALLAAILIIDENGSVVLEARNHAPVAVEAG